MKFRNLGLAFLSLFTLAAAGCDEGTGDTPSETSSERDFSAYPWGQEITAKMYEMYGMDIPFPTGTTRALYYVMPDDYGDPMLVLMCSFPTSDDIIAAVDQYAIDASDAGYSVSQLDLQTDISSYECSIPFAGYKKLYIDVVYGGLDLDEDGESEDYLGLFVRDEISVDPYEWPAALIEGVISPSAEVPAFEGEGITYNSSEVHDSDFGNYVSIVVYGSAEGDDLEYKALLEQNGYTVQSETIADSDGSYSVYLAWIDDAFFIQFNSGVEDEIPYLDINIAKGDVHDFFEI